MHRESLGAAPHQMIYQRSRAGCSYLINMANSSSKTNILIPQPSISEKESKRWKYVGYRGASQWMASEDDFFMVRRFATLNTRVILTKEAQIADLERQLEEKDLMKAPPGAAEYDNSTVLEDYTPDRQNLLARLWRELKEYSTSSH